MEYDVYQAETRDSKKRKIITLIKDIAYSDNIGQGLGGKTALSVECYFYVVHMF